MASKVQVRVPQKDGEISVVIDGRESRVFKVAGSTVETDEVGARLLVEGVDGAAVVEGVQTDKK